MIENLKPSRPVRLARLRRSIARLVAGATWPDEKKTTTGGVGAELWSTIAAPFIQTNTKRVEVYRDMVEMDDTVDEVATSLDILADNAVSAEGGTQESFWIAYHDSDNIPQAVQDLITETLHRTLWYEKAYGIARDLLKFGDNFLQNIVDTNSNVVRLMWMPPATMERNETPEGLLYPSGKAYMQVAPATRQPIAFFYPWQIEHMRWNHSGSSMYGRALAFTARTSWRKLQAMEEALVINWLTRAFARLLFVLDVTDKTPTEAAAHIREFKNQLLTRKIAKGVEGVEQLSVVKDIFIGRAYHEIGGRAQEGLADVKVLDTSSTGFSNLAAIEYYRGKVVMSMRVPPAYLGLEENINAKATLEQQDRRFARTIRALQTKLSTAIKHTIDLQLLLKGLDPKKVPFYIMWPPTAIGDSVAAAQALFLNAKADALLMEKNVIDPEYVATRHLNMKQVEWEAMEARLGRNKETTYAVDDS